MFGRPKGPALRQQPIRFLTNSRVEGTIRSGLLGLNNSASSLRLGALVPEVFYDLSDMDVIAIDEMQGLVRTDIRRKPVFSINLLSVSPYSSGTAFLRNLVLFLFFFFF